MTAQFVDLSDAAWRAMPHARLIGDGKTLVGCAVRAYSERLGQERIFTGVNVQHKYRSHDIHAEVNAIGNAITAGYHRIDHVFIAAHRERFTPCGACLDWIFELGGPDCPVSWQSDPEGAEEKTIRAHDLMPWYPC